MTSRIGVALLAALLGAVLAVGCSGNSNQPFALGGPPTPSPGNPSIAPASSRTVLAAGR